MKILIAYDGSSHADIALDDLRWAGLPREAEALVLSVADVWARPLSNGDAARSGTKDLDIIGLNKARAQAEQAVEESRSLASQAAERVKAAFPSWKVYAESCADSPAWGVIKKTDEWPVDLIVVGSQGRSALGRLILGSVSQKILYESSGSVRISRGRAGEAEPPARIIIGVDGSSAAEQAISVVAARNWPSGTQARVVAVQSPLEPVVFSPLIRSVALVAVEQSVDMGLLAQKIVDLSAERLEEAGLIVSSVIREGDPKHVLIDEARHWGADCIFVGARGLRGIERFLLGSVSSYVAARASCSVEVVRT